MRRFQPATSVLLNFKTFDPTVVQVRSRKRLKSYSWQKARYTSSDVYESGRKRNFSREEKEEERRSFLEIR